VAAVRCGAAEEALAVASPVDVTRTADAEIANSVRLRMEDVPLVSVSTSSR
jgi:hypothetical protein